MAQNIYGELNPLYPTYEDPQVLLDELTQFFTFSYLPSSGYQGTGVFEIDDGGKTYFLTVRADPSNGARASAELPSDASEISFYCQIPFDAFNDAFWGRTSLKNVVMGGGCTIKNWAYRAAYNLATSFDLSSQKWDEYYRSGISIKPLRDPSAMCLVHGIDNVYTSSYKLRKAVGPSLPVCANDAEFMYEWKPNNSIASCLDEQPLTSVATHFSLMRPRAIYQRCLSLAPRVDVSAQLGACIKDIAEARLKPVRIAHQIKSGIKQGTSKLVDEYYGWHSQYTRYKIGTESLSMVSRSFTKLNAFIHRHTRADHESVQFSMLNSFTY